MYQQAAFDYATLPTDAAEDLEATGASVDEVHVVGGGVNETQASKKQGGSLSLSTLYTQTIQAHILYCLLFQLHSLHFTARKRPRQATDEGKPPKKKKAEG